MDKSLKRTYGSGTHSYKEFRHSYFFGFLHTVIKKNLDEFQYIPNITVVGTIFHPVTPVVFTKKVMQSVRSALHYNLLLSILVMRKQQRTNTEGTRQQWRPLQVVYQNRKNVWFTILITHATVVIFLFPDHNVSLISTWHPLAGSVWNQNAAKI